MVKKMLSTALLAVLSACGSSTGLDVDFEGAFLTTPIEVTLTYGEDRVIPGTVLRMTFASVVEDSRCPSDVVCVWEGNATVEVGIGAGTGPTFPLQLNTSLDPRSVEWNDVLVTLLALTPDPVSDSAIPAADYAVTLRLEPVG